MIAALVVRAQTMGRPQLLALLPFVLAASFPSCVAPPEAAAAPIGAPMGRLGLRIGTFVRLEGVRATQGKVGDGSLLVDHVDGVALAQPVELWVENLALPKDVRCALSGYETGRWIGLPPEVERAEHLAPRQAGWQLHLTFIATSVQAL